MIYNLVQILSLFFVSLITADLLFPTEFACCNEQGVKIFEADLTSGSSNITTASSVVISWLKTLELIQEMKHATTKVWLTCNN